MWKPDNTLDKHLESQKKRGVLSIAHVIDRKSTNTGSNHVGARTVIVDATDRKILQIKI